MPNKCIKKSKMLSKDLGRIGFKGGYFNLCNTCIEKYGIKKLKESRKCVFGC